MQELAQWAGLQPLPGEVQQQLVGSYAVQQARAATRRAGQAEARTDALQAHCRALEEQIEALTPAEVPAESGEQCCYQISWEAYTGRANSCFLWLLLEPERRKAYHARVRCK